MLSRSFKTVASTTIKMRPATGRSLNSRVISRTISNASSHSLNLGSWTSRSCDRGLAVLQPFVSAGKWRAAFSTEANPNTTTTITAQQAETVPTLQQPEIEVVHAENAPKAIGPYSQAIKAHNTLYVSGCIGLDPKTAEFPSDDVQEQARQAISNLKKILAAGDSSLARVVKTTVLLTDINDFAKVNAVYSEYFTGVKPARTTYAVAALPKNAKVEIEAIALVGKEDHEETTTTTTTTSAKPNANNNGTNATGETK